MLLQMHSLDLTDVVVGAGENLLGDKLTLEEREFGHLVEVVDALRISAFHNSPPQGNNLLLIVLYNFVKGKGKKCHNNSVVFLSLGLPEAPFLLNQTTSVDEIEKDFAEFFKLTSQSPYGNFVAPEEITLREEESAVRVLPEVFEKI